MITIYQKSSNIEVGINQGSIRRYNLMKEDFIKLKFSLTSNVPLLIGDYVDLTDNGYNEDGTTTLFKLDRNYYPTFNENTGGWDYDVQFNAHYHLWKNKVLMFNPEKGAAESSFSLTDTIQTHVGLLVSNLEYANFTYDDKYYKAEVADELKAKGMKPITYSAVTMYGALDLIAQAYECEWWVVGNTIYFGYRKDERFNYTLTLHEEIANVIISDSDGVHATRLYAFGGTTNVPKHYRDKLVFTANTLWYDGGVVKGSEDGTRKVTSDMFRGTKKQMAPKLYRINQGTSSTGALGLNEKEPKVSEVRQAINIEAQNYSIDLNNLTIDFAVSYFNSSTESTGLIEVEKSLTLNARVMLVNGEDFYVVSEETRPLTHGNGKPSSTFTFEGIHQAQPKFTPTEIVIQLSVLEAKWRFVKYEGVVVTNDEWKDFSLLEYAFTNAQTILTIQKDAKSVDTTILINGGSKEYNATINPDFVDNGGHILVNGWEGRVEDIKTYQFPKIVINKVPSKYFTVEDGGIQTGVVQKNLMLPEGVNYVQADGVDDSDVVEAIMVYDWIYPKTELAITNVEPYNDWNVEVEDGEDYKVTTYDITLPIADYENALWVDPSQMYAIFQKGNAAGLRFELNPVKQTKTDVTFRLVPNEDYQTWIPNEATKPTIGDTLILEGIDISFIDSSLIAQAEDKVLEQAQKDVLETAKEDKVVDITLSPEYALKTGRIALGAYTSLVDVLSSEGEAYESRVLGFEECLDIPWDRPKYIIGDRNYYNRTASIETKLNNIEKGSITLSGVNVGGSNASPIQIIRAKDATEPSDKNVYSAIRSREEFAKRKEEETFSEKVTFEKGIEAKGETKVSALSATRVKANTASFNDATTKNLTSEEVSANHLTIGDFDEQGDLIQGARVTKDGVASFAAVKTPSMQVYELTLNRKTAVQGEYIFSDGETIEEVSYQRDDDTYQLRVREPYEGYVTTFKVDDILYSNINIIGEGAKTGKCWMLVTGVNGSTITAKMYAAAQCPSGENIAPMPHMTITRHGNRTDKSRQDLFIISSETSSLTMLRGVDAPIVSSEGLYGIVLGKLPSTLLDYIKKGGYEYVNGEDPYVYARGVIVQDLIMLDYQGKPIRQEVYRGHWSKEVAVSDPYISNALEYNTATHNGSLWQCMVSGTKAEPKEGIADWLIKVAKGEDATATIYELVPSANIIYYRTAEKTLSINTLDVKVGQTTSYGYSLIDEQNVLTELGLKVSYAIDGVGEPHDINISPVAAYLLEDGTAILATEDDYGLSLEGEDINVELIKDNITLYLTDTTTDKDMATYVIPVVKDGEEGKKGANGTSYYMAGELIIGTAYAEKDYIIKDKDGNITDKPIFFRIPNGSDKPNYYVLQRGITAEENTIRNLSDSSMWKPFTKMENLYAEFLMADWAKFGGPNGAIFYGKYLFSQKGIDKWGNEATWGKDMFDASGNLTGKFIPNMMFNFETGEAMLGRLTETLRTIEDPVVYMDSYRNAVVTPTAGYTGGGATQGFSKPLVILPQVGENNAFASGTRISIFAQVSTSNRDRNDTEDNLPLAGVYKAASTFALVSADNIVDGYIDTDGYYKGNWIMADGYRSKFLLIGAGEMVNMRLSVSEGMNIWVVENDADVTNMPCMIYGQKALNEDVSTVTASVNYNDYTGENAWRTINSYGTSRDASWKSDNLVNNQNAYIPAVLATKSVRNSLNSTAFIGLKQPHIILSTNADGWLDNHHYRLYDPELDKNFPTITQK